MRPLLLALILPAAGCAGAARADQVHVRELRSGTATELSVIRDPVTGVVCYKSSTGLACFRPEELR